MATNLALDDKLIEEVQELGDYKTKRDAVNAAMREFIRMKKREKLIELFGTIEFSDDRDPKAGRRKRSEKVRKWLSEAS